MCAWPWVMPLDDALGGVAGPTRDEGTVTRGWDTGGVTDLILDSLQRRMRALHSLYYDAVATMTIDHVNHFEREGVVPIAFCLFHITNMMDASFLAMTGTMPIWNDEWADRVKMTINDHGKHRTVDEMVDQRIGDYDAFQEYMRAVFARTEAWLDGLDPAELDPGRDHPALPAPDRQHLQRPGRRSRGHHAPRRHRVLDLPARPAPHGRDRARPRPRRPPGDDLLDPLRAFCVAKAVRFGGLRDRERSTRGSAGADRTCAGRIFQPGCTALRSQHSVCARSRPVRSPPTDVRVSPRRPARAYAGDRTAKPIQRSAGTSRAERPREKPKDLPWRRKPSSAKKWA